MVGFEPGTLRLVFQPLTHNATNTSILCRLTPYPQCGLITWSWEGLVCGLNIVTGLTSCGL